MYPFAMHISLIVPAPFEQVSGGYGYDRRMVAELRAGGATVDVVELAGRFPLADDAAREAACTAWDALGEATRPVIDGLALPAFSGMEDALAARGAVGLIHHPTALETGFPDTDRDYLRRIEQRLYGRLSPAGGHQRGDRRYVLPLTSELIAHASASLRRALMMRRGATARVAPVAHSLGRHAGPAQGPRRAAARARPVVRSGLEPDHRRLTAPRSGACGSTGRAGTGARCHRPRALRRRSRPEMRWKPCGEARICSHSRPGSRATAWWSPRP